MNWECQTIKRPSEPWVSVKFLIVGETNSMVGYHLMAEDHSVHLGVWGGEGV